MENGWVLPEKQIQIAVSHEARVATAYFKPLCPKKTTIDVRTKIGTIISKAMGSGFHVDKLKL
jgi:hypothetical protein